MNKFVTENLMLLEFLIDEIYFTPPTKKKIDSVKGETNAMFQFLDNKPILITSTELQNSCAGVETRCGKSCLFSMSTEQGIEALGHFLIKLKIFQKFPPGVLPNVIDIACGEMCISELFQDLMESAMGSAEKAWVKCQKETVKLFMCGECVGSASVFIRMSCYGKYIVTQCEMNMGDFQEKTPKSCVDQNQQQSKCLPLPATLVQQARDSAEKEEMPKRQVGAGEVMNEDPCNRISRQTDIPCSENQMKGDFVSKLGARDMAFQMLDHPQMQMMSTPRTPASSRRVSADYQRLSGFTDASMPISNFSQLPYEYPVLSPITPPGTPGRYPPFLGQQGNVRPCDPCPSLGISGIPLKEIMPRPPQKKVVIPKPTKDKILMRLAMPNYGPKEGSGNGKPYEFEFVTPAGWPRQSLGRQCRDCQCDCRDFPKGYLLDFYGGDQLRAIMRAQMEEEMRREQIYGICPVGQFANVKRPKGGIAELLINCFGIADVMKGKNGGGAGGRGGKGGKGGKGGRGGRGGGGSGDGGSGNGSSGRASGQSTGGFKPKRKLHSHCGIPVPDKRPVCPPCDPCVCMPCQPGTPCAPCRPCSPCAPCAPCSPRPCSPCGRLPCRPTTPCAVCPSATCAKPSRSLNLSSCNCCYQN